MHRNPSDLHNHDMFQPLRIVLENNYFNFNGRDFHQVDGTAVGYKLVPCCAKILCPSSRTNMYIHITNQLSGKGS